MPRRLLALTVVLCCVLASPAQAGLGTWNKREQRTVHSAGLMADLSDGAFHGERRLDARQLGLALGALAARNVVWPVTAPQEGTVSVTTLDRLLVEELGLGDVAAAVQEQARHAGLRPPSTFGTEVVARLLGLRTNHPFPSEELELYPWEPITRAEAAHSFAVAIQRTPEQLLWVRDTLARFVLPQYSDDQRRVLRVAVSKIGMPYIWGGETDTASWFFGGQEHGGYDCSGFAWRVFKLSGSPWGAQIHGRTAATQAGEIRRAQRVQLADVAPADLLFFGPGRFHQRATERRIVHEGIALSAEWMIHSSDQGVYVSPLFDEWRAKQFSWARRLL